MNSMSPLIKSVLYVMACVSLWALIPVVSKTGQRSLDNHQFLFWTSFISFAGVFAVTAFTGKLKHFRNYTTCEFTKAAVLGFMGTYLYYILLYYGYANTRGMEVLVLQYSWPLFMIILSAFILGEKISAASAAASILGFAGVMIVLTKGNLHFIHMENLKADIIVILGALTFALFSVLSKNIRSEPYTLLTIYFFTATVTSLVSMLTLSEFRIPDRGSLTPVILNGLFVNGYSYIFWIKALKNAHASFVAPFVFLTPVISSVYLINFLGEPPENAYILGLLSVIAGGLINSLKMFRPGTGLRKNS